MKSEFRTLRLKQLERALRPFLAAKASARPQRGWLRAIREASGTPLRELSQRMGKSAPLVNYLEKSEADYRITLGSLRDAADALGCELVYALVPRNGSIHDLAEERARTTATENVRAVEHSMALEDQAVGGIEDKIAEETKRMLESTGRIRE
jgi:predicted DNA-binding mobile mystery protein A